MEFKEFVRKVKALIDDVVVQRLVQFFLDLNQGDRTTLYILLAVAVAIGLVIGRYGASRAYRASVFQNRGEMLVASAVRMNFEPPEYHLMNHITLQLEDGTTQIDHILVSRYGVFVIETKDYSGWIFANAQQKNWTQVMFKRKYTLQNPIIQNGVLVICVQKVPVARSLKFNRLRAPKLVSGC